MPKQTTPTTEECTTSSAVASCLEEVFILTEYFTLDNGVSTSTIESVTENNCVTYLECDAEPTTTTTTTSSATSKGPASTCTAQVLVPEYKVHLDNVTYYIPLCSDPVQTLWRSDGSSFALSCDNITLSTGTVILMPADLPSDQGCQAVTANGVSVCFTKRFAFWNSSGDGGVIIPAGGENRFANLSAIAGALAVISDSGASDASQGLSHLGCTAQSAFSQVAAYYFDLAMQELATVISDAGKISKFFDTMSMFSQTVTGSSSSWIDEADEALQNLACHINTSDSSQIARALTRQSALHSGLNTLGSIESVASEGDDRALLTVITDLFEDYLLYIGMNSTIIEGWTQTWRLCNTEFDYPHLVDPASVKPNQDDVDNWSPRYSFYTNPGTTIDQLRAVEHSLGEQGTELTTNDYSPDLVMGYLVDLNILQATLPLVMPSINCSEKLVWYGDETTDNGFDGLDNFSVLNRTRQRINEGDVVDIPQNGSTDTDDALKYGLQQQDWNPRSYPAPNSDARSTPYGDLYDESCE